MDCSIYIFGCFFYIESESLIWFDEGKFFCWLMLVFDIGIVIVGLVCGDIFIGFGLEVGELVGFVCNDVNFFILVFKVVVECY